MRINETLSFSSHSHLDLKKLIEQSFVLLGVPKQKLGRFDAFSTIQVQLKNNVLINVSLENDRLWIWSPIFLNERQLIEKASVLIPIITTAMAQVETAQFNLGMAEQHYELKALISPIDLTEKHLANLINFIFIAIKQLAE
ncbi:MAG: hypothetical protein ACPGUD_06720 [Parashewanella sp.]